MKKITEITTEHEFVSKLRTYYRKARRKGYQRNEISFLGLMEYTGSATREFEYQSDKYFSVGIRAYDWQYGNSLLFALIDKWENEIEAEKRKKQPATPAETLRISTETAETVNVSADEKKAAVAAKKPIWKQANELAGEYEKRGYQFVYNERTKLCYLTIPGHIFVDGSQCTTELTYVMTGKIDGFRDVPKAVGEYNAMYCAKYAERCPQMLAYLPTEPRETVNVSVEGENAENEPIKHISEIMETCRTWDDEKRDYTDEYKYYTWLANHIPEHKATNKNTTELILEKVRERISAAATFAAHGVPKCDIEGAVCAVVNRLAKMEDVLQFCNHKEPPQSPETPQAGECSTDTLKPRETARKRQNRAIGNTRHSRLGANGYTMLDNASATLTAMSVPRECSTVDAAHW